MSGKRLVGLLEYLDKASEKTVGCAFASISGCAGAVLLLWAIIGIVAGAYNASIGDTYYAIFVWAGSAVVTALGLGALWCAKSLFREAKQIVPVALLTKASLNRIPDGEALVRASDSTPSQHQAELLRATQQGKETPAEELLRATITHGEDE